MEKDPGLEICAERRAWVAFGANLPSEVGTPRETLFAAVLALSQVPGLRVTGGSRVYETPCFPNGAGPDFINFAVEFCTSMTAAALLKHLHEIEAKFGRLRRARWAGRGIDLDLLAFEDEVAPDMEVVREWVNLPLDEQAQHAPDQMILPHPRLQDRAFMLIPFAELAPDWRHPILGKTVIQMLDALPESEKTEVKAQLGVEIPLE